MTAVRLARQVLETLDAQERFRAAWAALSGDDDATARPLLLAARRLEQRLREAALDVLETTARTATPESHAC